MCKTIKQKVRFKAAPDEVYHRLADSGAHARFSGEAASIDSRPGGAFSLGDGRVTGIVIDLVPGKRLVQAWRERDFPEGVFSMATFNLSPTSSGGTELVLTHRGVPKNLLDRVETDWRERHWERMKRTLGP